MKNIFLAIISIYLTACASFEAVVINPNSVRIGNVSGFKKGDSTIPFMGYGSNSVSANYMVPFGLSELSMQEILYFGKYKDHPYMISGVNFGNEDYRENTFKVTAGVFTNKDLQVFPSLKLLNLKDELENKTSFGLDLNAGYSLYEKLTAVMSVINLYAYETDNVDIPMTMCLNFEFKGVEYFNLYTGIEKNSRNEAIFKTGLEYVPFTFFSVSAGYNFDPELITTGFSLEYKGFNFNYGMSYHFDLDYSHSFGIVYEF